MSLTLIPEEARIIGCLMEKSVVTPEQYPLTLNALTNACNQKSSREPVMQLEQGTVQRTARLLEAKHLLRVDENFKSRVEKYTQRLCNTPFSDYQFDPAQYAVMTLLLLRGAQTPGELRAHSGRLHSFADNGAVIETLNRLMDREGGPLVAVLPRQAGRKDSQYMHLWFGPIAEASTEPQPVVRTASSSTSVAELEQRVSALEHELPALKERPGDSI